MRRIAALIYALGLILHMNARVGMEPFTLAIQVRNPENLTGTACVEIDAMGVEYGNPDVDNFAVKSCWDADDRVAYRFYNRFHFGEYDVRLTLDGVTQSIQRLKVICTEHGNKTNIPRCPEI